MVFGHPTLSRPISALLSGPYPTVTVVASTPRWTDVAGHARVISAPVRAELLDHSSSTSATPPLVAPSHSSNHLWLEQWLNADHNIAASSQARIKDAVCAQLWEASCPGLGKQQTPALMIGASDVIRSFDRFATPRDHSPIVTSNRGLAGIDGTISTAWGLQAGLGRPLRVVLGDLSALHDLTGFLHGSLETEPDLQIVVLNDHGGAIFGGLEHAKAPRNTLERFFLTPQDADFQALAHATGWKFVPIDLRTPQADTLVPHDATKTSPHAEGLALLADLLSHPIRGRSLVEVLLPEA